MPSIAAAAASSDATTIAAAQPDTQPGERWHEGEHDEVHAEEPEQRNAFAPKPGRGLRTEDHPDDQETDHPDREIPEHGSAQSLRAGEQPGAPRRACAVPVCACGAACQEEQGHDLGDPGERPDRGHLAEQVVDVQPAGVDGGEQQRAVSEHDHHERREPGDVDGAIPTRCGVARDGRGGGWFLQRHEFSMPRPSAVGMSRTTRRGALGCEGLIETVSIRSMPSVDASVVWSAAAPDVSRRGDDPRERTHPRESVLGLDP